MQSDLDLEIRPIHADEFASWGRSASLGFSNHSTEARLAHLRNLTEIDRAIGAFSGDAVVGTATACSFELTVPGARYPVRWSTR